jgi:hypothetical protein
VDIGARVEEFTTWVAIVEAQRTSKFSQKNQTNWVRPKMEMNFYRIYFNNWTKSLSHLFLILINETNIMEEVSFCKEPNELCLYIRVNSLNFWRSANMKLRTALITSMGSVQFLVPTLLMMHSWCKHWRKKKGTDQYMYLPTI